MHKNQNESFPCSIAIKHVNNAVERLENQTEKTQGREESVLQKILQVDKDYAIVMALDMIQAGIDTVNMPRGRILIFFLTAKLFHINLD